MTIPSSMLAITTTLSGKVDNADFEIVLDCETKNLFGYSEPESEFIATDNPENRTLLAFFGKSRIDPAVLSCVFDTQKWKQLEAIKKHHPIVFFDVQFECEEIGYVQSCSKVAIGRLSGASGRIAPKFELTLIPKGGKSQDLPVSTISGN